MGNIRHNLLNHLGELGWLPEEYSSKEDIETVTAVGDLVAPKTPQNLSASNGTERIKVEWDKVTKNADGSDCNDLSHYNVYYSSSSGIDINDDDTYDGIEMRNTLAWSQEVSIGKTKYYVVTAEDQTGNESSASNEDYAESQSVTVDVDVSDYNDNFSDIQVGDGIIGLIFRQPNSGWDGYSHYKLYRDTLGGSSWTSIFEGPNPAYIDKKVSSGTNYKYKLTFVDVDGSETSGTVRDNSSSGYNPNNADNSNITAQTFLAPNIVAQNEVRGNSVYAESQIVLGGVDDSGYIKSSSYSAGSAGFKIDASGSAEFNDVTVRGKIILGANSDADWGYVSGTAKPADNATVGATWGTDLNSIPDRHTNSATTGLNLTADYLGYYNGTWQAYIKGSDGSGQLAGGDISWDGTGNVQVKGSITITNTISAGDISDVESGADETATHTADSITNQGDLATENKALVTNGDVGIDGDLEVTGNLQMAYNSGTSEYDVQLGASVPDGGGGTQEGLYIKNGGAYIEDSSDRIILNSTGKFTGAPYFDDLTYYRGSINVASASYHQIMNKTGHNGLIIHGGLIIGEAQDSDRDSCFVRVSDSSNTKDFYPAYANTYGSSIKTDDWARQSHFILLPSFQTSGDTTIQYYNGGSNTNNAQYIIFFSTVG